MAVEPKKINLGAENLSDDVVLMIRRMLPSLRPAERRVGRALLADASGAPEETIDQLAGRAGTSAATVTRFCRTIGLSGFRQLRTQLAIASEKRDGIDTLVGSDLGGDDDLAGVVVKFALTDARAIHDTIAQLDLAQLADIIGKLRKARRIDLYGAGASYLVALDLQQKLCRIGRVAYAWSDTHMARTGAAILRPGDVAIAFSKSGETPETIRPLRVAKEHGAHTIAVTSYPRSAIARVANTVMCTASDEVPLPSAPTSSRMAQLAIVDCVFAGLAHSTLGECRVALSETYHATHRDFDE